MFKQTPPKPYFKGYGYLNKIKKRSKPMTICIATICEYSTEPKIVFCADRLVTDSNGLTFEQGVPKIDIICDNCLVMSAGLASESDEIIRTVMKIVKAKCDGIEARLDIKEIAYIFKNEHQKLRDEKIEDEILKPRGLSLKSFYEQIKNFPEWLGIILDTQISNYKFGVNFLVFGFDVHPDGLISPHIYKIDEQGEIHILDKTGFGIIGIGDFMSLPEITRESYSPNNSLSDAITRTYWAKKTAERVVSVGSQTTDLGLLWFEINENDKILKINNVLVNEEFQSKLKRDFDEQSKKIKEMTLDVQKNIDKIFSGEKSIQSSK